MTTKSIGIKRKCGCCKEEFYINKDNIKDAIYYDKTTYHSSCFINFCNKKIQSRRKDTSVKWTNILDNIQSIQNDSFDLLYNAVIKDEIYYFIRDSYDVTIIPTTVWQKLNEIYNGTFKGMINGIPPEHLLDMWQKKINKLNGIANKNISNGKSMSVDQRISYDLSILINKYDSYLKWLEKQKILQIENTEITTNIIDDSIKHIKHNMANNSSDDISSLVDDIFG